MSVLFPEYQTEGPETDRVQFNVRLLATVKEALRSEAEVQGVPLAALVERIIVGHLQAAHPDHLRTWRPFERRYYALLEGVSGIYIFKCLANGRIYVGQATDLAVRLATHARGIAAGTHSSENIRMDGKIYGLEQFQFDVLERVPDPKMLNPRERHWHDLLGASTLRGNYNAALPSDRVKAQRPKRVKRRRCGVE